MKNLPKRLLGCVLLYTHITQNVLIKEAPHKQVTLKFLVIVKEIIWKLFPVFFLSTCTHSLAFLFGIKKRIGWFQMYFSQS